MNSKSEQTDPGKDEIELLRQALRDQEAEIAELRKIKEERWAVVATRNAAVMRAEKAGALLRECDAVARRRGDKCGLCDSIDNDGQPYQSAHLAAHLGGEHE
jgi:hypothetical protein